VYDAHARLASQRGGRVDDIQHDLELLAVRADQLAHCVGGVNLARLEVDGREGQGDGVRAGDARLELIRAGGECAVLRFLERDVAEQHRAALQRDVYCRCIRREMDEPNLELARVGRGVQRGVVEDDRLDAARGQLTGRDDAVVLARFERQVGLENGRLGRVDDPHPGGHVRIIRGAIQQDVALVVALALSGGRVPCDCERGCLARSERDAGRADGHAVHRGQRAEAHAGVEGLDIVGLGAGCNARHLDIEGLGHAHRHRAEAQARRVEDDAGVGGIGQVQAARADVERLGGGAVLVVDVHVLRGAHQRGLDPGR